MKKIEMFWAFDEEDLQKEINDFLECTENLSLVDIKYQMQAWRCPLEEENQYYLSAMVIYEEKQ